MRWRLALCLIACAFPAAAQLFNIASFDARPGETTFGNGGQPWPIGTAINAENYDTASKSGIAFNVPNSNTLPACQATTYRADAANLQTSTDGPAFQIGCPVTGTSYQYIINVATPSPCPCKVTPRLGSPSAGGSWAFYIDDTLIGAVATPNTGSYTTMQGVDSAMFNVASGNHTVRWQWASGDANGYAGSMSSFLLSFPFMTLTASPTSPTIPASAALGSTVAVLSVTWSDGHTFSGLFGFAAPNFDDGGIFAISGSNVIVNPVGPGVSADGGTIQNITVQATE